MRKNSSPNKRGAHLVVARLAQAVPFGGENDRLADHPKSRLSYPPPLIRGPWFHLRAVNVTTHS